MIQTCWNFTTMRSGVKLSRREFWKLMRLRFKVARLQLLIEEELLRQTKPIWVIK